MIEQHRFLDRAEGEAINNVIAGRGVENGIHKQSEVNGVQEVSHHEVR